MQADPAALIVLAGNFNRFADSEIVKRTGLTPLIRQSTRGDNTLDRLFVSEQSYEHVKIVTSTARTDHKSIVASGHGKNDDLGKQPVQVVYRRTPHQHATRLLTIHGVNLAAFTFIGHPQRCERFPSNSVLN